MDKKQEKLLHVVMKKTGVSQEEALHHLQENQFKVNLALKSIEKELYTPTELILRKCKDKETAFCEISQMVEEKYQLPRNHWLNFKDLKHLPSEVFSLMVIIEWLIYEDYEDFEVALFFQLEEFTKQIEENFGLSRLANSLRKTEEIVSFIYEKYKRKGDYLNANEEIWKNEDFQECERLFRSQRALIIEKLYDFMKVHINKFP